MTYGCSLVKYGWGGGQCLVWMGRRAVPTVSQMLVFYVQFLILLNGVQFLFFCFIFDWHIIALQCC